jgi:nickel superoxide dismutase
MRQTVLLLSASIIISILPKTSLAHCEVPCGIYNDELRIELIKEHIQTIEKAMIQITEIQKVSPVNYNQLVRWITTKETHATLIQEIAEQYFLTQRVKITEPEDKIAHAKYIDQLVYLHQIIIYAMKTKQSTDIIYTKYLTESTVKFEQVYFGKNNHRHNLGGEHK